MEPLSKQQIAKNKLRERNSEAEKSRRFINAYKAIDQLWTQHSNKYGEEVARWPEPVRSKFQSDERGLRGMFIKPDEQEDFDYFVESTDLDKAPTYNSPPQTQVSTTGWHDPVQQPEFLRAMSKATGLPETYWKRGK